MVRKSSKVTKTTKKEDDKDFVPVSTEESRIGLDDQGHNDPPKKRRGQNNGQKVKVKLEEHKESELPLEGVPVKIKGRKKSKTSSDLCQDKPIHENLEEQKDMDNDKKQQLVNRKRSDSSEKSSKEPQSDTVDHNSNDSRKGPKRNRKSDDVKQEIKRVSTRTRVQLKRLEHVISEATEPEKIGVPNDKDQKEETENTKMGKPVKRKIETSSSVVQATRRKKMKSEPVMQECSVDIEKIVTEQRLESDKKAASGSKKFVGAHTSIAGGLSNAIRETLAIGGRAFGMFLKSQRTWNSKPLEDSDAELFKATLKESGISPEMVVPHGSYLLNCGSADDTVLQKSRTALVDELKRCDKLGLPIYNFHPGSSKGEISSEECINRIAETINLAHSQTCQVITVIENMSGQGNTIGGKFSELKAIIDGVKDKSRIGVCLDTCHAFAAGYDIKSEDGYEEMKKEFVSVIGHNYLKAVHLNDSKGELGCHQDRHENIGKGKLGLDTFKRIMNDTFFDNIPMILETPEGDYGKEISKLYSLCDK